MTTRKTDQEPTKERILTVATRLFNEATVAEVSTNHIAEAAGISPGNLYYHYDNKEAIIRALLERMFAAFGEVWTLPSDRRVTVADVEQTLYRLFTILWRFRFFYREHLSLLRRDPRLAERYQEMQQQRIGEQERFFMRFVHDGVVRPPNDDGHFRDVITACWIVANNWLSFIEESGDPVEPDALVWGVRVLLRVLEPYLSPSARTRLASFDAKGVTYDPETDLFVRDDT